MHRHFGVAPTDKGNVARVEKPRHIGVKNGLHEGIHIAVVSGSGPQGAQDRTGDDMALDFGCAIPDTFKP